MNKSTYIVIGIVVLLIVGIFMLPKSTGSTKLDAFATCLGQKGATFYGAFWCPHCQAQKALFGASVDKLPYVECSNPDQTQNKTCNDKQISSYPTWQFADGSRLTGEIPLDQLAQKTGCTLPQ